MRGTSIAFGSILLMISFLVGCGGDTADRHAISGVIKVNDTPLADGTIRFEPVAGATVAGGAAVQEGQYSIPKESGLPKGKYRVSINAPVPGTGGKVADDAMPGDAPEPPTEMIPPSWNIESKHVIEVKSEGPFEFDFAVDTKKK